MEGISQDSETGGDRISLTKRLIIQNKWKELNFGKDQKYVYDVALASLKQRRAKL